MFVSDCPWNKRWVKLFDRRVWRYDPTAKPWTFEPVLERKRSRSVPPLFYVNLPADEGLLARMRRSTVLAQHFLSTCRSYVFTGGLGNETFWGSNLARYKYFWPPPQNVLGFDYLEDLISEVPTKFVSPHISSYHRRFYPEHGFAEYETAPSPSLELSFALRSNPIDSPNFFMMMIEPAPKKIPYTFFVPSFHYQRFPEEDPPEVDENEGSVSSSWRDRLSAFVHPREEEEVDHVFKWRYVHERTIISPELMSRLRSIHVFRDAPISYKREKNLLRLTWK